MRVFGTKTGTFGKIAIFILGCLVLQSCWKDKTLKDKQSPTIDIEPTYGIPLVDYELTCEKLLEDFNNKYLNKSCLVQFDKDGLGYFLYDKVDTIFNVDLTKTSGELNGQFNVFSVDDNNNSISLHELKILTYAENYSSASFNINAASMFFNGGSQNLVTSFDNNGVLVSPIANGAPSRTFLFEANLPNPLSSMNSSNQINYNLKASILSNTSSETEGQLKISPIMHIPAWMTINNNVQQDTMKLDKSLSEIFNYNDSIANGQIKVKGVSIRLGFTNSFPIATKVQCVMMDSNYNVVGNLFSDYVTLEAASINRDYTIKNVVEKNISVDMTEGDEMYNKMLKTKYFVIQEIYNTNGQDVKLLKNNKLLVKANIVITAKAKGEIDSIVKSFK